MDPSSIVAGVELGKSGWSLLQTLRSIAEAGTIGAYFRYDGTRVDGSAKINVELHYEGQAPGIWWYSVSALHDYAFLREPVNPSAIELVGHVKGEVQPDSTYWRWVAPILPGRIYGGGDPPNLKVDFLVFGYRPRALLKYFARE